MDYKKSIGCVFVTTLFSMQTFGQHKANDFISIACPDRENYNFEWKQTVLPLSLIGIGAISIAPSFINNGSKEITNKVLDMRGSRACFDDYLQYIPVVSSLTLGCIPGTKPKHTFKERTLIVATSYATLGILTNVPKHFVDEKRPEFAGHNSFPSGHTATAFMGAELMRIEYGGWYGIGAYTIAATVGFMRLYNGRHWFHDVVAGAGVGILSARIGEWSCQLWQKAFHKGRNNKSDVVLIPIVNPVNGGQYGVSMGYSF